MMNHKIRSLLTSCLIFLGTFLLLVACHSDEVRTDPKDHDGQMQYTGDVELQAEKIRIWWDWFKFPYKELMGEHLTKTFGKEQFETVQFIGGMPLSSSIKMEGLFHKLRNEPTPDLIVFDSMYLSFFIESNYLEPLTIDVITELEKDVLGELRAISSDRQLYALPYGENVTGLFYNKKIFDEMNLSYPTDGMTWDEVLKLASGIKTSGNMVSLHIDDYGLVASQLSLELFDKETKSVDFETEAWAEWERFLGKYLAQRSGEVIFGGMSEFTGEKIAMIAGSMFHDGLQGFQDKAAQLKLFDVEWDVVQFPVFDAKQPVAPGRNMLLIGIPRMSENKEDAYKLIRYLLSEPVQFENMRRGLMSLRVDAESRMAEFGAALWSDKSTSFIDSSVPTGKFDPALDKLTVNRFVQYAYHGDDPVIWRVNVDTDQIRDAIQDYRSERTKMIKELKEMIKEHK